MASVFLYSRFAFFLFFFSAPLDLNWTTKSFESVEEPPQERWQWNCTTAAALKNPTFHLKLCHVVTVAAEWSGQQVGAAVAAAAPF